MVDHPSLRERRTTITLESPLPTAHGPPKKSGTVWNSESLVGSGVSSGPPSGSSWDFCWLFVVWLCSIMEYFGQVGSKKQSELVFLCGLWSPAVGDLIFWNCQPRTICVSQSQQPSSREGHTYGVEILIVSPQQMTLSLDRRTTMHKTAYASPSSRQRT